MAQAKRPTKAVVERRAAGRARHEACGRAYRAAVKLGFAGKRTGAGCWDAIRAFCLANAISYPGPRAAKARKEAKAETQG